MFFRGGSAWRQRYVAHLQVVLDDFLGGGPVVHDQERQVEGLFGGDGGALLDGDAWMRQGVPSELRTRYSWAPSTMLMPLRTSSTLMSWGIMCCACLASRLPSFMQLLSIKYESSLITTLTASLTHPLPSLFSHLQVHQEHVGVFLIPSYPVYVQY